MILDQLANAACYYDLNPRMAQAFDFLHTADLRSLASGRHELDGQELFVLVGHDPGRGRAGAKLEAHQKYLDIQLAISGNEEIGWKPRQACADVTLPYDESRDLMLFGDVPDVWVPLAAGNFMIFLPEDAHAPLGGVGKLHKVVVKVAMLLPTST